MISQLTTLSIRVFFRSTALISLAVIATFLRTFVRPEDLNATSHAGLDESPAGSVQTE
jgi:hypothetical protein